MGVQVAAAVIIIVIPVVEAARSRNPRIRP
jgi:hypothetical protein